jgi:hypothetical protein
MLQRSDGCMYHVRKFVARACSCLTGNNWESQAVEWMGPGQHSDEASRVTCKGATARQREHTGFLEDEIERTRLAIVPYI